MDALKKRVLLFCVSFAIPIIFFRIAIYFLCSRNGCEFVQSVTGLTVHHFHFGFILLLIGLLLLIFYPKEDRVLIPLGLGVGTIADQFIPSLFLETERAHELALYSQSYVATFILMGIVVALAFGIYYFRKKFT